MTVVKEKEQKYFMDHHHHAIIYEPFFLFLTIPASSSFGARIPIHLGLFLPTPNHRHVAEV